MYRCQLAPSLLSACLRNPVGKVEYSGEPEDFKLLCVVEEMKEERNQWEILYQVPSNVLIFFSWFKLNFSLGIEPPSMPIRPCPYRRL